MFCKSSVVYLCCVLAYSSVALSEGESEIVENKSSIIVTTVINSTAQRVWDVMVDFKKYSIWNRWYKLDGEAKKDAVVRAQGKDGPSYMHLNLQITSMNEPHTLCWDDVTWFTYLGAGGWRCRTIEVLPENNGVKFINYFQFTGVFKWFLRSLSRESLKKGMILENESLKDFIESVSQ